jgi:hypothetical protein
VTAGNTIDELTAMVEALLADPTTVEMTATMEFNRTNLVIT